MRASGDIPTTSVRVIRLNDGNAEITLYRGWGSVQDANGSHAEGDIFILTTNLRGQKIPWNEGLREHVESHLDAWYALAEAIENVDPMKEAWGGADDEQY